jgi:hypothetical protein
MNQQSHFGQAGDGGPHLEGSAKVKWTERVKVYQDVHPVRAWLAHGLSIGSSIGTAFLQPQFSIPVGLAVWVVTYWIPTYRLKPQEIEHTSGE